MARKRFKNTEQTLTSFVLTAEQERQAEALERLIEQSNGRLVKASEQEFSPSRARALGVNRAPPSKA